MKVRLDHADGSLQLNFDGRLVTLGGALPKPPEEPPDAANDPKIDKTPKPIIGAPKDPPVTLFMAQGAYQLAPRQALYISTVKMGPDEGEEADVRLRAPSASTYAVSWSDLSNGEDDGLVQWLQAESPQLHASMTVAFYEEDLGTGIDLGVVREKFANIGLTLNEIEILYVPGTSAESGFSFQAE